MAIKTLWTIILKVYGLWFGFRFLELFVFSVQTNTKLGGQAFEPTLSFYLVQAAFFVVVVFLLLFKTNFLIEKLGLSKDCQDEKIDLNQSLFSVLRVVVIFIGLLMFTSAFPAFLDQLVYHFQVYGKQGQKTNIIDYFDFFYLIKSVVGLLLVALNQSIAGFISRRV